MRSSLLSTKLVRVTRPAFYRELGSEQRSMSIEKIPESIDTVSGPIRRRAWRTNTSSPRTSAWTRAQTSCPRAVQQGRSQPCSDAPALPGVLYQYSQIDDSRCADTECGNAYAGRAVPGEKRLLERSIPKQRSEVIHAVGETMEPVEQAGTRAAAQHGQDGFGVRCGGRENLHLDHAAGHDARLLPYYDIRHRM